MTDALLDASETEDLFRRLSTRFPGRSDRAKGAKRQPNPFRSVVSCMLSAQSLDRNTARATQALFRLARTPRTILALDDVVIATAIRPCGLYNVKTRNLKKMCRALLDEHDGKVPETREELMSLPGVGRKCADIVMSFAYGHDVIAVDTHIHRVCNRTGLARGKTEAQTARSLEDRAPDWSLRDGHFWLLNFGKTVCRSRSPGCGTCPVNDLCLFYRAHPSSGRAAVTGSSKSGTM
ncbi:MAG: endonuclease III domain-containing protein [Minwuia sp.]|uniref:endonuclease III domain-containing protein n=1 Tax=Minwuia sp. TaxID=2493630 RepID=UPI003A8A3FD9